ncbi:EamA family transporter [Bradyrhizobium sp. U87765 SZCCT0131]|uniref:EamA family transporter n=1 Tax=unclassified Bradyrhizobium TaxID=2631580 RepID=UPI001BAC5DC7|nr:MULTISPECIES: EamA family transporter [unclassified Bradyrhizobium]MBR1222706.1 EamA family transporter [Bradyrhizobium sp. U87765 SZCCT0131]MBR1303008.1 EamA family transporter [Bradyrhizobium sp. U87765 SZCCT0110]MBR1323706.1 EamA family transporter [Bradyrhizobium sp. U87765 SZCCT0109]MBR1265213.1 EamA family transporter [Bradyrhizobium sp. U87765 SZCCT0134]MBR1346937.1 EamA family transporter [Bradyrhizobium sp. U87765 SZCCT0048]
MKLRYMAMAALTSVVWGLAFVATKLALQSFSASQLTALRFLIASLPVLIVPRPPIGWPMLVTVGLTLFTGQFLLLFFAFEQGLSPGLASVTQQMQVFFTVALAAVWLGDLPGVRQCIGMVVAFGGLLLIGLTVGDDLRPVALALALGGAFSWAVGNVLVKRLPGVPVFPLIVWASLVPPLPALALSAVKGEPPLWDAVAVASWPALCGAIYLGAAATMAYAIWGRLLQRFPAGAIAPFALLSPCVGVLTSAVVFGELFAPARFCGMALIFAGVVIVMLPVRGMAARPAAAGRQEIS